MARCQDQFTRAVTAGRSGRLAVNPNHLLTPSVRHSGKNARLGHGGIVLVVADSGDGDVFVAETTEQQTSGVVVSYDSHREHVDAQGRKIIYGIRPSPRDDRALAMPQDHTWGRARNAGEFATE